MDTNECQPRQVPRDPTLFLQSLAELLESAGVSLAQLQEWYEREWLSFRPEADSSYDVWHHEEILFIKTLVSSGIGELLVQHFLDGLEPPYQYQAMSTAYCFGRGQWVHVRGEPGEIERLTELAQFLNGLLDAERE
jgi:hypothetical protein